LLFISALLEPDD